MPHLREDLNRLRSKCQRMKIEHYHRKYNNDDSPKVVSKRDDSVSSWSLRKPKDDYEKDGDHLSSINDYHIKQGAQQDADEISIVTVFDEQQQQQQQISFYDENEDNFTVFNGNEFYYCNCQDEGEEVHSDVSLSIITTYNDSKTATAIGGANSNTDINHSTLFKQYFGSKFDLLHKSNVNLPHTECKTINYAGSYSDRADIPNLHFDKEDLLQLLKDAPIYFDREQPLTSREFHKIVDSVELNTHSSILALLENCQCVPCQSRYTWKLLEDTCALIKDSWEIGDGDYGITATDCVRDISDCNFWKGPAPLNHTFIADNHSIENRFKSFKLSRKFNDNRLISSRNRFLNTNGVMKNSFKNSSKRNSDEASTNLIGMFEKHD